MLRDDLHFSPAAWNPGHCLTSSAKSARDPVTSRALLPRGFLRGRRACPERAKRVEGCRQADEGAALAMKLSVFARVLGPFMKIVHFSARTNTPSSASGTLRLASLAQGRLFSPPLKNAVGRRMLDEHCVSDST